MRARHLPNLISALRLVLVLPTVWALLSGQYGLALALFLVAAASDGVDGFLAKRFGWHSQLGAVLDPVADKTLMAACYLALAWLGALPLWLLIVVLGRDLVIVAGALAYHLMIDRVEVSPTIISKLNTAAQLALVLIVLMQLAGLVQPGSTLYGLIYLVLATTLLSGGQYVWTWGSRALRSRSGGVSR